MPRLPPRVSRIVTLVAREIETFHDALARSGRRQMAIIASGLLLIASALIADHRRVTVELDALGERLDMFVVAVPVSAGDDVTSSDVRIVQIPRRFRVASAINDLSGRIALHDLNPGDPLTTSNTTTTEATALPEGWRALTIDAGPLVGRLTQGTVVDVMANGEFLVEGALVLDVVDDTRSVLIAVPQDRVVTVADAASIGVAVLAIAS